MQITSCIQRHLETAAVSKVTSRRPTQQRNHSAWKINIGTFNVWILFRKDSYVTITGNHSLSCTDSFKTCFMRREHVPLWEWESCSSCTCSTVLRLCGSFVLRITLRLTESYSMVTPPSSFQLWPKRHTNQR